MADSKFFSRSEPFTIQQLADLVQAEISDPSKAGMIISDVAALDKAGESHISFLDNIKYKDMFTQTKAAACIVAPEYMDIAPSGTVLLMTPKPYKAYAHIAQAFYPATIEGSVSEKAIIGTECDIGEGSVIAAGAVLQDGVKLGAGSFVDSGAVLGRNVEIGQGSRVGANAVLSHCIVGDHVNIYPGCCIGQDGFGFAPDPAGFVKVPQLGRVIIGNGVEIGSNTTIDRGAGPDTEIGDGTWIDNLVQIGHNVKIGRSCIIISQVGISGSSVIGDYAVIAGQAGIAGHLNVGMGARIGAQSGVMRDVPAGEEYIGSPAMPARQFMRQIAAMKGLIKKKN